MDEDLHIINQRRKRSRSVGSIDSDAPDEYYVELRDLQEEHKTEDDTCWSKSELEKISKITANMLNDEQEENIKKSFRSLFPSKEESEIIKMCATMKDNIVKELLKKEKMMIHKAKRERLQQRKAALVESDATVSSTVETAIEDEDPEVSRHVHFENANKDEVVNVPIKDIADLVR